MNRNYDIIEELLPDNLIGIDLHHYTSADGLFGILNEKKIRCTHIFYLNDIEENLNGWKIFFKVFDSFKPLKVHLNLDDFKSKIEQLLRGWRWINVKELSNEDFRKIDIGSYRSFVFSLSQVEDDLNQWRSYTPASLSFSVCFNFNKDFISKQLIFKDNAEDINSSNCKILIRRCVYDNSEKENIMTRLLYFYFTKYENREPDWGYQLFFNILTLCLFFKNENFEAEKECRIVVLPLADEFEIDGINTNIIKIRKGKSFLIPYIELDTIASCVKTITLGPTPFKHHSMQSLKIMMTNLPDYSGNVKLKETKIPFRSW